VFFQAKSVNEVDAELLLRRSPFLVDAELLLRGGPLLHIPLFLVSGNTGVSACTAEGLA
jgi:hypothetical protein